MIKSIDMRCCKGFTLIELLITVVLIGIIAAVAGLNLVNYTINRNLRSAARSVTSDFAVYRERAIAQNTTYEIVFAVGGNSYDIKVGNPPAVLVGTRNFTEFGSDIVIQNANFAGGNLVDFFPRGTAAPLPGSVTLTNKKGTQVTINVNATGRTYVKP